MPSKNRPPRRLQIIKRSETLAEYAPECTRLNYFLEKASLHNVTLEERRREALKPMYLLRYE